MKKTIIVFGMAWLSFGVAEAGTLKLVGGKSYTGTVVAVEEDSLVFLWQRDKDQPEAIRKGKSDLLFAAQGAELEKRNVPLADIESVDGVAITAYPALFKYNIFYRALNDLEGARIQASATGDFINQVKGIVIFMGLTLIGIPLLICIIGLLPIGGDRIPFLSAILYVLILTALGFGAGFLCRLLVASMPAFGSPAGQVAFSAVMILVFAFLIFTATRRGYIQGLLITAAWAAGLLVVARVVLTLVQPATYQIY